MSTSQHLKCIMPRHPITHNRQYITTCQHPIGNIVSAGGVNESTVGVSKSTGIGKRGAASNVIEPTMTKAHSHYP